MSYFNHQLPQQHPRKAAEKSPGTPINTITIINTFNPFNSYLSSNWFFNFLIIDSVELVKNISKAQIKDLFYNNINLYFYKSQ